LITGTCGGYSFQVVGKNKFEAKAVLQDTSNIVEAAQGLWAASCSQLDSLNYLPDLFVTIAAANLLGGGR